MLAASYWSLLSPAIEMAEESGLYGPFTFVPVSIGFLLGAGFVYAADIALPYMVRGAVPQLMLNVVCCICVHTSCSTFSGGTKCLLMITLVVIP